MPHLAASSIIARLSENTEAAARSFVLKDDDVEPIRFDLNQDACDLQYSALISLVDAVSGIQRGHFSWSTVQLYYICF